MIHPSLVNDILIVDSDETQDFAIYNLLGQELLKGKNTKNIDVSSLPQSTYILKIGIKQTKFVKL